MKSKEKLPSEFFSHERPQTRGNIACLVIAGRCAPVEVEINSCCNRYADDMFICSWSVSN